MQEGVKISHLQFAYFKMSETLVRIPVDIRSLNLPAPHVSPPREPELYEWHEVPYGKKTGKRAQHERPTVPKYDENGETWWEYVPSSMNKEDSEKYSEECWESFLGERERRDLERERWLSRHNYEFHNGVFAGHKAPRHVSFYNHSPEDMME